MDVRITTIGPMRVASFVAVSDTPEDHAHEMMARWLKEQDLDRPRVFGFNNPCPAPGHSPYGYEFWVALPDGPAPGPEIAVRHVPAGRYAVARLEPVSGDIIPAAWKRLNSWCEQSGCSHGSHQWLEEHFLAEDDPRTVVAMDLCLPISG